MTTESKPASPEATPAAPAAPAIDVAALTADITQKVTASVSKTAEEKATAIAAQKLAVIGKALSGEQAPDTRKIVLETFVDDPLKALHTVRESAKNEAVKEIRQELAYKDTQVAVSSKFMPEYPELKATNKLRMVEKIADDYVAQGKPYNEALELGFQETIKEFGLKSVSEAQRNSAVRGVGLPTGGGFASQTEQASPEKVQSDFLAGMQARARSFRTRK